ncbi:AraC family transcriptional regulator [Noviherbaspirillum agri]
MNKPVHIQEKTVAIGWVRAIIAAAQQLGAAEPQLLARAGMDVLPVDPLARLPLDAVVHLWRAAVELTGNPAFGLRMGQSIQPTSFNVVAYTLVSSSSLREAVAHMQQFQHLVSDGGRIQLLEKNGFAWLVYHPVEARLPFSPQQVEAVLACTVALGRWIMGNGFAPSRVCFAHAAISDLPMYHEVLDCEPEFGGTFSGIALPAAQLDAPLPARNPELCRLHESLARQQLALLHHTESFSPRVAAVLQQLLAQGMANKEKVAGLMGISPRTLQQRLAEEGSSFVAVQDEVRHRLALQYLADPMLSLGQIAVLLNFSDASAFYRAFRRWTGTVPGDYRRTHRHTERDTERDTSKRQL